MTLADQVIAFMRSVGHPLLAWQEDVARTEFDRGYRAGVRDARQVQAVQRRDEAAGARQPYPNE